MDFILGLTKVFFSKKCYYLFSGKVFSTFTGKFAEL